jgi:hypothetical protein
MKKLVNLRYKEILEYILNSKELSEKFNDRLVDNEMWYVGEVIKCFPTSAIDFQVGVYNNNNFFRVLNNDKFLEGVENCIETYGASSVIETKLEQCKNLVNTNLYNYHVKELGKLFFEKEILSNIKYAEELSMLIYNKDHTNQLLIDRVDDFIDVIEDIYINNDGKLCKLQYIA